MTDTTQTVVGLAGNFNKSIGNLLKTFEARARTDADFAAVATIRRRLLLAKQAFGPEAPLVNAAPILVAYADIISSNDSEAQDKFILHVDIEAEREAKGITADEDSIKMMTELVAVIRRHYEAAPPHIRNGAIKELQSMLQYSIQYLLITS